MAGVHRGHDVRRNRIRRQVLGRRRGSAGSQRGRDQRPDQAPPVGSRAQRGGAGPGLRCEAGGAVLLVEGRRAGTELGDQVRGAADVRLTGLGDGPPGRPDQGCDGLKLPVLQSRPSARVPTRGGGDQPRMADPTASHPPRRSTAVNGGVTPRASWARAGGAFEEQAAQLRPRSDWAIKRRGRTRPSHTSARTTRTCGGWPRGWSEKAGSGPRTPFRGRHDHHRRRHLARTGQDPHRQGA